jgi:hypothetical protein
MLFFRHRRLFHRSPALPRFVEVTATGTSMSASTCNTNTNFDTNLFVRPCAALNSNCTGTSFLKQ